MKKIIFLALSAALAFSVSAGAQAFSGLSLSVGGGTDGLSFEIATPLGDHLQLRAGYGLALGLYKYNTTVSVTKPATAGGGTVSCPTKLNFAESDGRLLLNIYPGDGVFHFTAGVYLGSSNFVRGTISGLPAEAKTHGMDVAGKTIYPNSSNEIQTFIRTSKSGFAAKPYLGIGFGRPVHESKTVSFSVDLGCMYQGKPTMWFAGQDASGKTVEVDISNEKDMAKPLDDLGKYMTFWPVLHAHLYVNLF